MKSDLENIQPKKKSFAGFECNRIVISPEANSVLEAFKKKISDGFTTGMIHKSDIANYVLINLDKFLGESDFKIIKSQHFDDRKVLSSFLRKSGDHTDLPDEIKKALREHYGINEKPKKNLNKAGLIQN